MSSQASARAAQELSLELNPPVKSKKRIAVAAIGGLVIIIAGFGGIKFWQIATMIKAGKSFGPPPESVSSAKAESAEWQASRSGIGTLVAVRAVILGAEVTGMVREILFDSGASVKKDQVLVRLDTSIEQAQLESALADEALAKLTLERQRKLRANGVNAAAELDAAEARAKQTAAAVATLRATIAKKTVRAPFEGRVAIRQVELGQVVSPGTTIASLQSVTPIYAEFSLPQQSLAEVKVGQKVQMHIDIFPGSTWDGKVSVINPEVDVSTRNVRIRAIFDNPDGRLAPGMFASVEVLSDVKRRVTIIPATSVIFAPFGDSVYVLEETKDPSGKTTTVARQRFVRLGERRGDFVEVVSGIKPGETVASSGAFKLRNGVAVMVNNALAPDAQIAPRPTDK
jgi:membrane fusion protein (multidrug efflux system)